jgi:alpha-tubulin suppressor-like RCC1 family protein
MLLSCMRRGFTATGLASLLLGPSVACTSTESLDGAAGPCPLSRERNFPISIDGGLTSCALFGNGDVWCWGDNSLGQVEPSDPRPVFVAPHRTTVISCASDISGGSDHECAAVRGRVFCWGANEVGQLGNNAPSVAPPSAVDGVEHASDVDVESDGTCAVDGQTPKCWGRGPFPDGYSRVPVAQTGVQVMSVDKGALHACGVALDGVPYCWGRNDDGQLGIGTVAPVAGAVVPKGLSAGVELIWASASSTCVIARDLTVWCWGANADGGLGKAVASPYQTIPVPIGVIATAIAPPLYVRPDHELWIWVKDPLVGDPMVAPSRVSGVPRVVAVSGGPHNACVLSEERHVYCWGYNLYGQVGIGSISNYVATPTRLVFDETQ